MVCAKKDEVNPYFKSKYADLASCWEACREPLSKNGLSIIQTTDISELNNAVVIETTLLHSSGEWVTGSLQMPLIKTDPQGVGSAMTYGRRYGLSAIVGIVSDDDDGEAAMNRDGCSAKTNKTNNVKTGINKMVSQQQQAQQNKTPPYIQTMFKILKDPDGLALNNEAAKTFMERVLNRPIASSSELSEFEADIITAAAHEQVGTLRKGAA